MSGQKRQHENLRYTYRFAFDNGETVAFDVELTCPTLEVIPSRQMTPPSWAKLEHQQCANCPLSPRNHACCPVAANLAPVLETFRLRMSYDSVEVTVDTPARRYFKKCSLQEGLSSLVGLIMPTSGCPHLDKLRPMVATHLPFATAQETIYRALTSYILAQLIRARHGESADWSLADMTRMYDDIRVVNESFSARVRDFSAKDAGINAVVRLDAFADMITFTLSSKWWQDFEPVFTWQFAETACEAATA